MAPDYGKLHQMLLQSIQSRSVVTRANVKERLKEIASILGNVSQVKITEDDLTEVINEINFKISPFGMELKEVLSEYNAEKFIVLINTVDCSCTQERIDHKYTVREREVFRVLLEAIVQSETYGSISSTDALHLHVPNTPFRVGEMEELLERLKADKWFIETESGHIAPGVRCIAEFEPYLKKNFEDYVQDCPLCSNVVFYGVLCPHCDAITHKHCFRNYNSRKGGNSRICPKQTCKKFIPDERNGGDLYEEQNHEENNSSVVRKRLPKSQRSNCTAKPLHNKSSLSGTDDSMDVDDGTPGPSRVNRKHQTAR